MKILKFKLGVKMLLLPMIIFTMFQGCKEDVGLQPLKRGEVSDPVSNIRITPMAGGAVIKYNLPTNKDFRYVKAVYVLNNGDRVETKSTQYKDSLLVEGFSKAGKYNVELYSVSVGEVQSQPVSVSVDVLKPYNSLLAETLLDDINFASTYGGVNVYINNVSKQPLVVVTMKKDNENKWINIDTVYSSMDKLTLRVRGVDGGTNTFGVFIQDKWQNNSDTIVKTLTPLAEIAIPKSGWEMFQVAVGSVGGDWDSFNANNGGRNLKYKTLWDNKMTVHSDEVWFAPPPIPFSFSIDLGAAYVLSRLKTWSRMSALREVYTTVHIKKFQIWGSNNPNVNDPGYKDWFLLGTFESIRPSGLPFGQSATTEDMNYVRAGEEWDFPDVNPKDPRYKNRYLRIKVLSTWNGIEASDRNPSAVIISELSLWGQQ
ncbi:Uncharacterised protein [Sphingobacterium spiritivorum]|uniref:DUF4959 domain-containing protein n=1 Tax=Sphingobacterium spiritivorum TaxID=258 RepID=A0A380BQ24_SPHSI|nr:DUF5000 domain-containing lipoprotein [Sphingobacterium spiritivorum]SUJ04561.1 Uncharacterised protein [Sphingobacterium spiritivorum]